MDFLSKLVAVPRPIVVGLLSPSSVFSIYSLAAALVVAVVFLALRQRRRGRSVRVGAILRALFSRRVLFHRSTLADLGYYVIGTLTLGALLGWAIVSAATISDLIVGFLNAHVGRPAPMNAPDIALRIGKTAALFLGYELGFYVDHSLKHRIPALWELHKTHHSAEVLTPLTNFRVHPLDSLMLANVLAIFTGTFGGLFAYGVGRPVPIFTIDGANILLIAYIFLTANLQHSQVWIPARGLIGRLFMSPAHHQIHHSNDPAHYNRNMGASLAIFDWLFGTLAMPERESQRLKFGVNQPDDPHAVTTLLLLPVANALRALLGLKRAGEAAPVEFVSQEPASRAPGYASDVGAGCEAPTARRRVGAGR
jgi:sterol desaturase/sphingolipid hydroxylase (fatty acid hydroxylase superfamily)